MSKLHDKVDQSSADVAIILPVCNGSGFLRSTMRVMYAGVCEKKMYAIDNASRDSSLDMLESCEPDIAITKIKENVGFAGAVNLGLRIAMQQHPHYYLILNQDVSLSAQDVDELVTIMDSRPDISVLAPVCMNYTGDEIDPVFRGLLDGTVIRDAFYGSLEDAYVVPFAPAAVWLIRAKTIEGIGGFDPLFFLYGEDNDYCNRVLWHGGKIAICPSVRARHAHGALSQSPTLQYLALRYRASMLVILKRPDHPFFTNLKRYILQFPREVLENILWARWRKAVACVQAFVQVFSQLPAIHQHYQISKSSSCCWLDGTP